MAPVFYFTLQGMQQSEDARPRTTEGRIWRPSPDPGAHISAECATNGHLYCFNGQAMVQIPDNHRAQYLLGLREYDSSMSVYHNRGNFWARPGDAINDPVDDNATDDWELVGFEYDTENRDPSYVSTIAYNGEHQQLLCQRNGQRWANTLLPLPFHASWITTDEHTGFGGVIGDLTLVIALMAFSRRRRHIVDTLRWCLNNGNWRGPDISDRQIGHGWTETEHRGMVVRILVPHADPTTGVDPYRELELFESGHYGKILD